MTSELSPSTRFCPRCDKSVRTIEPWRRWGLLWNLWKVGFGLVLVCFPLLAADYCVMLPSTMLYLVAGGLLRGYAREKPVCTRCSLEIDRGQGAREPIRPRPSA